MNFLAEEIKPWQITGGLPNFNIQILTISHDIYKDASRSSLKFFNQKFLMRNFLKFSLAKNSCYIIIKLFFITDNYIYRNDRGTITE